MNLIDPALFQYRFFTRGFSRDSEEQKKTHSNNFKLILDECVQWGQPEGKVSYNLPPEKWLNTRHQSVRIAASPDCDWIKGGQDEFLRDYEARILLDSFFLETGACKEGSFDETVYLPERWTCRLEPKVKNDTFLFGATLLTAEYEGELARADANELMNKMIRAYLGRAEHAPCPTVETIEIRWAGFLGVPADPEHPVWASLVKKGSTAERQRALRPSPELLLAWLKSYDQFNVYEVVYRPNVEKRLVGDSENSHLLARKSGELERLEDERIEIAKKETELGEHIGKCEEVLQTIKINLENVRLELDRYAPYGKRIVNDLRRLLARPLELYAAQIESDLHYQAIRRRVQQRLIEKIDAGIQVQNAKWSRRITLVLALFLTFEMIQAFQGGLDQLVWWHWIIVVVVVLLFGYMAFWSEVKLLFRR